MQKITSEQNFFTAGEMASLFGISKQTLLYYDKIQLLSPDYISDNGYRHYSIAQYLTLEIIVNMRSLNISIADIKHYLEHRSKQRFIERLAKKTAECNKIIKENERICRSLQRITNVLTEHSNLPLNQITVCRRAERQLRLTELNDADDGKQRIAKFARHSQMAAHSRGFTEQQAGWIVDSEAFFTSDNFNKTKAYFSFSENVPGHQKSLKTPLPTGIYLEIYFSGTFYKQAAQLKDKISRFLEVNDFTVCSDAYILPIENHWLCENTDDYINLLFIQVRNSRIEDTAAQNK